MRDLRLSALTENFAALYPNKSAQEAFLQHRFTQQFAQKKKH